MLCMWELSNSPRFHWLLFFFLSHRIGCLQGFNLFLALCSWLRLLWSLILCPRKCVLFIYNHLVPIYHLSLSTLFFFTWVIPLCVFSNVFSHLFKRKSFCSSCLSDLVLEGLTIASRQGKEIKKGYGLELEGNNTVYKSFCGCSNIHFEEMWDGTGGVGTVTTFWVLCFYSLWDTIVHQSLWRKL